MVALPFDERRVVVYHSLLGQPQLVEFEDALEKDDFCRAVDTGPAKSGFCDLDAILDLDDVTARTITSARGKSYIRSLRERISFLSLLTSEACNLGCPYCIAGTNMRAAAASRSATMSWDTAKQAVDWYFSESSPDIKPYVNFSGGEPLLNWPVVLHTLEYVQSAYRERFERVTLASTPTRR